MTATVDELRQKYARSVFEIQFEEDDKTFVEAVQARPWFVKAEKAGVNGSSMLRITARDVGAARKELPQLIAGCGLTLLRYELAQPSLEDIFVEVVGS